MPFNRKKFLEAMKEAFKNLIDEDRFIEFGKKTDDEKIQRLEEMEGRKHIQNEEEIKLETVYLEKFCIGKPENERRRLLEEELKKTLGPIYTLSSEKTKNKYIDSAMERIKEFQRQQVLTNKLITDVKKEIGDKKLYKEVFPIKSAPDPKLKLQLKASQKKLRKLLKRVHAHSEDDNFKKVHETMVNALIVYASHLSNNWDKLDVHAHTAGLLKLRELIGELPKEIKEMKMDRKVHSFFKGLVLGKEYDATFEQSIKHNLDRDDSVRSSLRKDK